MSIQSYRHYRSVLKGIPFQGAYVPYHWGTLPQTLFARWMPYREFFDEYSGELANAINQFANTIHRLQCWDVALPQLSPKLHVEALLEFVDPHATMALSLPYVIRSRFIFATAHLCHQANRARLGASWKDDLSGDDQIYFDAADEKGRGWHVYPELKAALEKISTAAHRADTKNFRNAFQHQMPPHIGLGLSGLMKRVADPKTGAVRYEVGGAPPLGLGGIIPTLLVQAEACRNAFEKFRALIREHEMAIIAANADDLVRLT